MKTSVFDRPIHPRFLFVLVNALLAVGLTVLSFGYVQPKDCYRFCGDQVPCPTGSCRFGEQKAGWPIPAFVDNPGGGSPTSGWGVIGPEDLPLPIPIILDVLFYSIWVWLIMVFIGIFQSQSLDLRLLLVTLPINALLGLSLWFFYLSFGFVAGFHLIGRGYGEQVYMYTRADTYAVKGFSPLVSVPLEELIENYGDPDFGWLTQVDTTEAPTLGMVLYWSSINMYAELPQIASTIYTVQEMTDIERIVFFDEGEVIGMDEKTLTEEKFAWTGYGNYQP